MERFRSGEIIKKTSIVDNSLVVGAATLWQWKTSDEAPLSNQVALGVQTSHKNAQSTALWITVYGLLVQAHLVQFRCVLKIFGTGGLSEVEQIHGDS